MTRTDDWADYLDPAEPAPRLPADERRALDRLAASIASPDVWGEPPAGLRAALLAAAEREQRSAAGPRPEPAAAPEPEPEPATAPEPAVVVPLRRRQRRAWYAAAAGVAAAAVLVSVLAWPRPETTSFPMAGTALAPRAHAVAELEARSAGLAIRLEVKGLPPAPAGAYYAAWLRGAEGVVPVGTFHWRKGGIPIDLWSGVGQDRYPELFVTLQREGLPPTPSSEVVLSGRAR